jgi:alanyl-tRNA synthetase
LLILSSLFVFAEQLMTKKLYWNNSHLTRFTARVTETFAKDGRRVVALDQTAFYPEGGGQPHDLGQINAAPVVYVEEDADGRILHHLQDAAAFQPGEEISGVIDWTRRRDLLQQHTGQHILSQAFWQLFGAETRGFRIAEQTTQIDLALETRPEELPQAIAQAEQLANSIVFDDRPINIHEVTPEEAARLPLRKERFIADCIRVIEIADYDWSPCGGTHARRTGEVGLIAVRGWERAKQMTRLDFICGGRALIDYCAANKTAQAVARQFSVGRDEAPEAVARLLETQKTLQRRVRMLAETAATIEAQELLAAAPAVNGLHIIRRIFSDRDFEETKLLAHKLTAQAGVIALLATREDSTARLVFARSANVAAEMNALLRTACERLGGRGGGRPDFAQGGGPHGAELEAALAAAQTLAEQAQ